GDPIRRFGTAGPDGGIQENRFHREAGAPMSDAPGARDEDLVATGITGLDDILGGGFTPNRVYLVEGNPGSGKTTLALRYLLEGRRLGEPGLYVTLSETKAELHDVARSHGWSLNGIALLELVAPEAHLHPHN